MTRIPVALLTALALALAATPLAAGAATVETVATLPANFEDLSVAPDGTLYAPSAPGGQVAYRITPDGSFSVHATGFALPLGGVVDSGGTLFLSSFNGHRVDAVAPDGTVTLFASGVATPTGTALSADEEILYVSSYNPGRILAIERDTGLRTVLASGPTILGPDGLALDEAGNLYVANFVTSDITRVDPAGNESLFVTLPGTQTGYIDYRDGFLYVAGLSEHRIYRVKVADGTWEVIAGTGVPGAADGPAMEATLNQPNGLALSPDGGTLWFQQQNLLRRVLLDESTSAFEPGHGGLGLQLSPAFPNPFRRATRLEFQLERAGHAELALYDVSGRLVRRLVAGPRPAGAQAVTWDGRDAGGRRVASGVYLARLAVDGERRTTRVVRTR